MTKEQWIERCAARFIKLANLTKSQATYFAEACFDAEDINGGPCDEDTPEDIADSEMSYWEEG
jgi:hypothetical protein